MINFGKSGGSGSGGSGSDGGGSGSGSGWKIGASTSLVSTLQQNINDELVNVSNWFKVNKLSINFNKTEFMVVTTQQNKPELKVSIDNNPIKQSHHIKYLGVLIDDNLNWKQQIKENVQR